jgi:hypothetical protein
VLLCQREDGLLHGHQRSCDVDATDRLVRVVADPVGAADEQHPDVGQPRHRHRVVTGATERTQLTPAAALADGKGALFPLGETRTRGSAYLSAAVDFSVSQVVDVVTGVHAAIRKADLVGL